MKLTVLVDNNTFIDRYFLGEPALSFFIEDGEARVIFDAGYSDAFVRNAEKLGIDLGGITHIVLSHGHDDHTRGLPALFALGDYRQVPLIAHPDCLWPKRSGGLDIGMPYSQADLATLADLRLTREPLRITKQLTFLGEIPRRLAFEPSYTMGERLRAANGKRISSWRTVPSFTKAQVACLSLPAAPTVASVTSSSTPSM